jgi:integrase
LEIDEDELDNSKLISIRTFINIVSLISLCQTNGEKIALNLLLLLIVTGLRSTEVFLLKTDALIKRPILDTVSKKHLTLDGIKQFTLGIQYYGAKGAGLRIHWLDPLSARLVETIFNSVFELTKEYREHLAYIRSKDFSNFLPKSLDDISTDYVEVDDLIGSVFGVRDKTRGRSGQRDVIVKRLGIPVYKEYKDGKGLKDII